MSDEVRLRWAEVEPLGVVNGELRNVLANVDTLRKAWGLALAQASPGEFTEAREIRSQYDALEFLADAARNGAELNIHVIRQLHQAICRTHTTYGVRTNFGKIAQRSLHHDTWKIQLNYITREDGTLLECTPAEHVQPQMERLLELYEQTAAEHPVVRAAWLHHRFIRIHPFEDGNGRVARSLTLLVLLRARYAPLVVGHNQRAAYIKALDQANDGDLRGLVRLFARFEEIALRSELELPAERTVEGAGALAVAHALAHRLHRPW